jgi:hypothetical protein
MSDARRRRVSSRLLRRALKLLRRPTDHLASAASRLTAATRYVFDLVLWSRIFARPSELARHSRAMARRGVEHSAPRLFMTARSEDASVWEEGFDEIYRLLLANLQTPDLISARRYGRPSPAFQGVYLWDSAFIAQVWKPWDIEVAIDVNLAVIDQIKPDGRLPHVTTHFLESLFTQPPLVAWSLWELHRWEGSERTREALRAAYPALVGYHDWLMANRRLDCGLYFWAHPYESGVENAPRFSSRNERVLADTTQLAAPDLSAYVVLQCEALASIARVLDAPADARHFQAEGERVRQRMNELLWHAEDGAYYDMHLGTGEPVRSLTIASLVPLWAGVPDADRAERLVQHVVDPARFGTSIPLPSVSRDDPDFAKDMWRGPTWVNTAYAVLLGMERFGYRQEAADVAWRLVEGVYRTHSVTHAVYEFYDPDRFDVTELHRKRGNHWKHLTLGAKPRAQFVGWSGLVNTIVIEHLIGFSREGGAAFIRPNLPMRSELWGLAVRLPALGLVVEIAHAGTGYRGAIYGDDGIRRFEFDGHERIRIDDLPVDKEYGHAHM